MGKALLVMDRCNGEVVCGLTLSVSPANEKLQGRRREGVEPEKESMRGEVQSCQSDRLASNSSPTTSGTTNSRSCDQSHGQVVHSVPADDCQYGYQGSVPVGKGGGRRDCYDCDTASLESSDVNGYRMSRRQEMVELMSSDEDDDDSLLDFEWDYSLLEELSAATISDVSRPLGTSATHSDGCTTPQGSSTGAGSTLSSCTLTPEPHPPPEQALPPLYDAVLSPPSLCMETTLQLRSVGTPLPHPSQSMDTPLPPLSAGITRCISFGIRGMRKTSNPL